MFSTLRNFAETPTDLEGDINSFSIKVILIASLTLIVLLVIASLIVKNKKYHSLKAPLFVLIASTIVLPSLLLVGSTVYINTVSESGGPVHWHTDYEMWVCGEEIEHRDPYAFLSNKTGTATYHEHDDKRIHLEGVVVDLEYDASLRKFMDVTEGKITNTKLVVPTEDFLFENDIDGDKTSGNQDAVRQFVRNNDEGVSVLTVENGQSCGDNVPAELQVFLIRYNKADNTYAQTKLSDPGSYIMRDESIVPPGDCLIIEFDAFKERTEYLCEQYGVRDSERCVEFGVSEYNPELCNIREVEWVGGTL